MPLTKARLKISDYTRGRKNRIKDQERKIRIVSLSLTSMVDMFAVLVVYLLINSSSLRDWVSMATGIELPQAKAKWATPEQGATLQVTKKMVLGGVDIPLISIKDLKRSAFSVKAIKKYLNAQPKKNGYVNVVADYSIPFGAMRKVIASCQDAGFGSVNLAIKPGN